MRSENEVVKHSGLETAWGRVQVLCPAATFTFLNFLPLKYAVSSLCEDTFASNVYIFEFSCQGTEQLACNLTCYLSISWRCFLILSFLPQSFSQCGFLLSRTSGHGQVNILGKQNVRSGTSSNRELA